MEAYRHDVKERENKIHRLSSELRLCYSENERLQKVDNQHQRAQDRLKQEAEFRILALRVGTLTRISTLCICFDTVHAPCAYLYMYLDVCIVYVLCNN